MSVTRWDEALPSPDLTGTGRLRLREALLALAVVPSARGIAWVLFVSELK